ncbi:MAG: sensor histidine kinase [Desulfobulbaceae bacterium]|nr:sensor histidine kinase [Desulfobulbaceae bacterium]
MHPSGPELDLVIIYFIYGLSFFAMGLTVLLEAGRASTLAEARVLRPLSVFGIIHGLHEWLEIFLMQWESAGLNDPLLSIARIVLLAISFTSLLAFGVQVLRPPRRLAAEDAVVGGAILILYATILTLTGNTPWANPSSWTANADVLARYLIAVPAALLAAIALRAQARQWLPKDRLLARSLMWAAGGFLVYALSQVFVKPADFTISPYLTTGAFKNTFGLPIQSLRGVMAALIAVGLIRAIHLVERDRQRQLHTAQQERFSALEQLQHELEKRRGMRRELLRHTVLAQEEERARIARELHDETSQVLTAASLNMATLKSMIPDHPQVHELIDKTQELCRLMARGLHRLVHDLRPAQLDDLGLVPSLHHLVDEARRQSNLKIKFTVSGAPKRIDPVVETVLFRITQEAITNITRHAMTDVAAIRLDFTPQQVSLEIEDQGIGFTAHIMPLFDGGCGLAGMRERAESVGGAILIEGLPNQGTKIEVVIPLRPHAPATSLNTDEELTAGNHETR